MPGSVRSWIPIAAAIVAIATAWLLPVAIGRYYTQMLSLAGIYFIVAQGLNLLMGYTGQPSLGHAGFYAIGAYTGALLATKLGFGFWSALPFSILLAAASGLLIALPTLKLEGPYLAMVTIAFGIIVTSTVIEWSELTGGTQGVLNIPRPTIAGVRLSLEGQFVLIVAMGAAITLALRNLLRSPWGRAFVAVRENPIAAQSVGLDTRTVKTIAFTISAALAGAGGHLFAFFQGFISPEAFEFDSSIFFLTMVIFGGAGTIAGPLVGAPLMTFLPEVLQRFLDYRLIIYGSLIVASLYALPRGIIGTLFRRSTMLPEVAQNGPRLPASAATARPDPTPRASPTVDGAIVSLHDVHMAFGGVRALNGISLSIEPGTIHALIGPNGAGKTVLLNVLSGYYRPTQGHVQLADRAIMGFAPHRIAQLGVARTFQTAQLFGEMTVLQNVLVGFQGQLRGRMLDSVLITPRLRREEERHRAAAQELLAFVGFEGDSNVLAKSLPFGHQRLVEIARALAINPLLVAMDEPAAGLNPKEIEALDLLITRIRARGIAVLLVEHHMDLVMGISDRITVLDHGEKLAEGSPDEIQADPRVVEAYLGAEDLAEAPTA
jgi:ABC-type branched-subunit amino acid transport system ATPase component/ABC-type branched-subunit amino acid transport system permease subunit